MIKVSEFSHEEKRYIVTTRHDDLWNESAEKGIPEGKLIQFFVYDTADGGQGALGGFTFAAQPGNCGIVVSTGTWLAPEMRGKLLSYPMQRIKEQIARNMQYTIMIATIIETNTPSIKSAIGSGYREIERFANRRTGNATRFMWKVL